MNRAPLLFAAAFLTFFASTASAQRGGTGQGGFGGFGGGMGMGGMSGMSGMGMGGMSGMSMGGMSSGMGLGSGMGMGGMGSGMGMGRMGGMGGFGSGMGGGFGQSGMGMQSGQQGFVGRDNNDMANIFRQMGRSSNQFFQQLNRTLGRGGRGRRNTSQEENAALAVRVRLDVVDGPRLQPTVAANNVRARLASTLASRSIVPPEVELAGDTVILRGVASSESQRLVIEQLAKMEPGVIAVDNQMTVANPSDSPPSAPAPNK